MFSESTLRRNLISSSLIEDDAGLSLGGGGKLESSSTGGATGLDTADPPAPPSTPLLTDGVFSESLHSSSSPEIKKIDTHQLTVSRSTVK